MPNFIDIMNRLDEMDKMRWDRLDEMDKKLDMIENILHGMMSEDKHDT